VSGVEAGKPEELPRLFAERANVGDLKGLLELYEEGATLVSPDGDTTGGDEAINERLQGLLAMAPHIEVGESRALLAGDIALLSNRWRMTFGTGEGDGQTGFEGTSAEVARRQPNGFWRYAIDDPASMGLRPPALPGLRTSPAPANAKGEETIAFEQLIYAEDGAVAHITLNRPERRNALSMQLSDELTTAWSECGTPRRSRCW
jgi:ketosteroid isomerase-like protein